MVILTCPFFMCDFYLPLLFPYFLPFLFLPDQSYKEPHKNNPGEYMAEQHCQDVKPLILYVDISDPSNNLLG